METLERALQPDPEPSRLAGADRLAEAFRVFNQASEELSGAYASLQRQVAQLTSELAAANGELRRQYQEKAALTERLALLLDALPAGVVLLDGGGAVAQCNPAAARLLGLSPLGQDWQELQQSCLRDSGTAGEFLAGEGVAEQRVAVTTTQIDSGGGRIVLLHDITEAHRLKTQAERNQRLAAMGEMAASLAHQLRTPLAAALLYAGHLERDDLPGEARGRCARNAVAQLKALERLIQDTLLFARGETLGREPIPVAALLADLAKTIGPLARSRGVDLTVREQCPGRELVGNRKAIIGALSNLLDNALQAAGEGGRVELDARVGEAAISLHVRDDGPGIDPAVKLRLFEPFFTTRADGTGLGLAIARAVALAHGGDIDVRSAPGGGSEFVLSLPLRTACDTGRSACGPSRRRKRSS